ncbi:hypothetical protein TSTA_041710 [Talaromyces stipitatus ATCC 10500]|uniref:Ankyrin repeat-containing protein n=1 Tax=Talaromyces stipitatus (strain ATCC 10500 / CBS 375.48 / QM 6759 / NRRL 1006) TaxID=441959 RepID=B8MJA5_TALSN|nr:uncharacterized protein TSTA_041710 [Talaromyces stipitatus ATCC 10500]EED14694.1 hypothetical protein TSTA_041710 [Talaromyces stipitatus ATCC 10500]
MEDCGSFISTWTEMGLSMNQENIIHSYNTIAERIVTNTWDETSHPVTLACFLSLQALFSSKVDITNTRNSKGQTRFHIAAHYNIDIVSILINRNTDVNARRNDGQKIWALVCCFE